MSPPKLNSGQIYTVTLFAFANRVHLGDYRTFAEALACARAYGATGGPDQHDGIGSITSARYSTPDGGRIHIVVEMVDPIDLEKRDACHLCGRYWDGAAYVGGECHGECRNRRAAPAGWSEEL